MTARSEDVSSRQSVAGPSAQERHGSSTTATRLDASPAALPSTARRNVLWIGGEPPTLIRHHCDAAHLSVVHVEPELEALSANAPSARALVLEFGAVTEGMSFAWAAPFIEIARQHGLLIAVTHAERVSPQAYYEVASRLDDPARVLSPLVAHYRDWLEIARACATHDPGPGANSALDIQGELPDDEDARFRPELRLLLARAFHDVQAVHVDVIAPGKSGANVMVVTAVGPDEMTYPHPFLVKVNGIAKIREEHQKFGDHIEHKIPWRQRPNVHHGRCVHGTGWALLVQSFAAGVLPLRDLSALGSPGIYVSSIFATALRQMHAVGGEATGSLAQAFRDLKALRWDSPALALAAQVARAGGAHQPEITELRRRVEALPQVPYRAGLVHGDLHAGNVFASVGSSDVIVIDFGNVMLGPVIADHACLEVSLAFRPRDLEAEAAGREAPPAPLDSAWLRSVYGYPLTVRQLDEAPRVVGAAGRDRATLSEAMRAIRGAAQERDNSRVVYAFAVASYLLRYAAFADHAEDNERALAYELASSLFAGLERELTG